MIELMVMKEIGHRFKGHRVGYVRDNNVKFVRELLC